MPQILHNANFNTYTDLYNLREAIEIAVEEDRIDELFVIVPTGKYVRKVVNDIICSYFDVHGKPVVKPKVFTLQNFALYCYEKVFQTRRYHLISEAYRLTLMEEAASQANLIFFKNRGGDVNPNVLQRLNNIIYGLKEDGIEPEDLDKDLEAVLDENYDYETVTDPKKLSDIAALYKQYQEILGDTYMDFPEALKKLTKTVQERLDKTQKMDNLLDEAFESEHTVLLYGFSEFKLPEIKFLSLFATAQCKFAIHLDLSRNNGPLFGNFKEMAKLLKSNGLKHESVEDPGIDQSDIEQELDTSPSLFLRRWLFNTKKEVRNEKITRMTQIIAARDQVDEVRSIAKLIKHLATEEGVRLPKICVALRQPQNYSNLFREVFAINKIPVNVFDRYKLNQSSLVIGIFSILDLYVYGFRRHDVFRAMEMPYFEFFNPDAEEGIDTPNIMEVSSDLRIMGGANKGGYRQWVSRIKNEISFREHVYYEEKRTGEDEYDLQNQARKIEKMKRAHADFDKFRARLPEVPAELTIGEFCNLIRREIIAKLRVRENILKFIRQLKNNGAGQHATERQQLHDEIEKDSRALSAFYSLLSEMEYITLERNPKDSRYAFADLVGKLKTAVRAARYQIRQKQNYGVNVTAIEQTRGIDYDVVILAGAIDKEFPMAYSPESFLGKELTETEERHYNSEKMLFYQFMTNNPESLDSLNQRIYIFYPQFQNSEELVRSSFIDDLLRVTNIAQEGRIYDLIALRKAAAQKTDELAMKQLKEIPWLGSITSTGEMVKIYVRLDREKWSRILSSQKTTITPDEELLKFVDTIKDGYDKLKIRNALNFESLSQASKDALKKFCGKTFSASEFEEYRRCPYKFFLTRMLRLELPQESDLIFSALERGNLLHKILYRFYTYYQKDGSHDLNTIISHNGKPSVTAIKLVPDRIKEYRKKLIAIATDELEKVSFDHPFFEAQKEEYIGYDENTGVLNKWLNNEIRRIALGWEFSPAIFEFGFGTATNASNGKAVPAVQFEKFKLRGKIDRVEFYNDAPGKFIIADYKSGTSSIANNKDIESGKAFQMPLYLAAMRNILRDYYDFAAEAAGCVYYLLKNDVKVKEVERAGHSLLIFNKEAAERTTTIGATAWRGKVVGSRDEMESYVSAAIENANETIESLSKGVVPVNPYKEEIDCKYCLFGANCRRREVL